MSRTQQTSDAESTIGRQDAKPSSADADVTAERACHMADADEPLGGDPPCWAHLFEDEYDAPTDR